MSAIRVSKRPRLQTVIDQKVEIVGTKMPEIRMGEARLPIESGSVEI